MTENDHITMSKHKKGLIRNDFGHSYKCGRNTYTRKLIAYRNFTQSKHQQKSEKKTKEEKNEPNELWKSNVFHF